MTAAPAIVVVADESCIIDALRHARGVTWRAYTGPTSAGFRKGTLIAATAAVRGIANEVDAVLALSLTPFLPGGAAAWSRKHGSIRARRGDRRLTPLHLRRGWRTQCGVDLCLREGDGLREGGAHWRTFLDVKAMTTCQEHQ